MKLFVFMKLCVLMISLNKVCKKPWVVDDKVVVRDILNMNAVVDHRFADGGRCRKL
jgi:pyruvate/2-oxoglutarate dehydrogenase complex dihydrolipoamide acyltransferase (E2) component